MPFKLGTTGIGDMYLGTTAIARAFLGDVKVFDMSVEELLRLMTGVSAVGDAQISTAQSKFGGASALFDGTGDYLQIPSSSDFDITGGDFTAEAWVRAIDNTSIKTIFGKRSQNQGWWLVLNSGGPLGTGQVQFVGWNGSTAGVIARSSTIINTNTWYHIALVKDGSNFKLFVDGALEDTQADPGTLVASPNPLLIGRENTNTDRDWNGHIDEVRISNTARYTTTFTPSTTPFVNDANTLLLLHMDGTNNSTVFFDDNGVRAQVGVSAISDAQISTAESKFGGASLLVNRSNNEKLVVNSDGAFAFSENDFTLELYTYITTLSTPTMTIFDSRSSSINNVPSVFVNQGVFRYFANSDYRITGTTTVATNTWYHIAVVKNNGVTKLYVNGIQEGSDFTDTINYADSGAIHIGGRFAVTSGTLIGITGHIDEFRISNTARYTANFTPATQPHVNDDNTLLLLHMDGTDGSTYFEDDNGVRNKVGVSAVDDAQISTAQSQFGGASALFDSTGTLLNASRPEFWKLGTEIQDWTIEGRIYLNVNENTTRGLMNSSTFGTSNGWGVILSGGKKIGWRGSALGGTSSLTSSTDLPTFEWAHFSIVRSGTTLTIYLNGTQVAQQTSYSNQTDVEEILEIGRSGSISNNNWVSQLVTPNCFLDEIRISNTARYTANFTPATEPFQNDDNTLLLLHMDGTNGSTTFIDDNGVTPTTQL